MTKGINKNKCDQVLSQVKERKRKEKIVDVTEEKTKLVIFSLLDDYYAIRGNDIKEIILVDKITFVPGSPDYILGIINVRGDIESVLNLNKLLGLPDSKIDKDNRIIVASSLEMRSGILVDSVSDVVDIPKSYITPPISTLGETLKDFVVGEAVYGDKSITQLDIIKIFESITGKNRQSI